MKTFLLFIFYILPIAALFYFLGKYFFTPLFRAYLHNDEATKEPPLIHYETTPHTESSLHSYELSPDDSRIYKNKTSMPGEQIPPRTDSLNKFKIN